MKKTKKKQGLLNVNDRFMLNFELMEKRKYTLHNLKGSQYFLQEESLRIKRNIFEFFNEKHENFYFFNY